MKLIFSINLCNDDEQEEVAIGNAKVILKQIGNILLADLRKSTKVALVREGDRAGMNLLLPKLQGRFGEHYQTKKAVMEDVYQEINTKSE